MTGYEQLEQQLREVIRHRAEPGRLAFVRRGVAHASRGLRGLPVLIAAGLSAGVLIVALGTLRSRSSVGQYAGATGDRVIELGAQSTPLTTPECPVGTPASACFIVLARATALQSLTPKAMDSTIVTVRGFVTAFTIGLGPMSSHRSTREEDIRYLDQRYGGAPQAAVTVLAGAGAAERQRWVVVAQSVPHQLRSKLGKVASFRLSKRLPVVPGDMIALTVPTWAPVLSIGSDASGYTYRQSRSANCRAAPQSAAAQLVVGDSAAFRCSYPDVRVEYSATEVTK